MRPVLFESNETDFTSNGLGRPDPISCEVTEERNGEYELRMVVSVEDPRYKDIINDRLLYVRHCDSSDMQPFSIYRITRPMNGKVEVYAEHISYRMSHIPVMPFSASSCTEALAGLYSNAAEDCPFTFWTDKQKKDSFSFDTPSSMRSLLGGSDGSVLDTYGGEWEFDGYMAKLHNARGGDNGVTLRYGKNITDLTQEENIQNTYTGILPFWKGTVQTDNTDAAGGSEEGYVYLPEKVLHSDRAANFPYKRTKIVDLSGKFPEKPTEEQLRSAGEAYMKGNDIGIPKVSVKVSFAALWQTQEYQDIAPLERVRLCDTVTVVFSKLGVKTRAKVVKTVYDCLSERYTEIELGEASSSLAQTIAGDAIQDINSKLGSYSTKTYLENSVDRASKLITGGLGGYVQLKLNADGQPEELLILGDDPDYTKAQEVWRWNKNGLAYSSTGYNGTFSTAITRDGHAVADFVDTGTLTANVVRAGKLQDMKNKNFWDMDTGEFSLASTVTVGGDTVKKIASDAVNAQTQTSIFNKLTNGGQTQGIYLKDGMLYINASYIAAGTLKDTGENTTFNLSTGELSVKKGSINLGNGNFVVDTSGNLTAKNASVSGNFYSGSDSSYHLRVSNGQIVMGYGQDYQTSIDYDVQFQGLYNGKGLYVRTEQAFALKCNYLFIYDDDVHVLQRGFTGTVPDGNGKDVYFVKGICLGH